MHIGTAASRLFGMSPPNDALFPEGRVTPKPELRANGGDSGPGKSNQIADAVTPLLLYGYYLILIGAQAGTVFLLLNGDFQFGISISAGSAVAGLSVSLLSTLLVFNKTNLKGIFEVGFGFILWLLLMPLFMILPHPMNQYAAVREYDSSRLIEFDEIYMRSAPIVRELEAKGFKRTREGRSLVIEGYLYSPRIGMLAGKIVGAGYGAPELADEGRGIAAWLFGVRAACEQFAFLAINLTPLIFAFAVYRIWRNKDTSDLPIIEPIRGLFFLGPFAIGIIPLISLGGTLGTVVFYVGALLALRFGWAVVRIVTNIYKDWRLWRANPEEYQRRSEYISMLFDVQDNLHQEEQKSPRQEATPPLSQQAPAASGQKIAAAQAETNVISAPGAQDDSFSSLVKYGTSLRTALAKGHLTAYDLAELRVIQLNLGVTDTEREAFEIDQLGETAESREQKDRLRLEVEESEKESRLKQAEERRLAAFREKEETDRKNQESREKVQQDRLQLQGARLGVQRKGMFLDAVRVATGEGSASDTELTRLRRLQIDLGITDTERFRWESEVLRESTVTWGRNNSGAENSTGEVEQKSTSESLRHNPENPISVDRASRSTESEEKGEAIRAYSVRAGISPRTVISKLKAGELRLVRRGGEIQVLPRKQPPLDEGKPPES